MIERALRHVDRRILLNRALDRLATGACLLLGLLIAVRLAGWVTGALPSLVVVAAVFGAGLLVFLAWDLRRDRGLPRAAGVADRRGDLKDELKSAYWFLHGPDATPWTNLQVHRAARTAEKLRADVLVPAEAPRAALPATGMAVLLVALLLLPEPRPLVGLGPTAATGRVDSAQEQQIDAIRELLQEAQELAAEEQDDALTEEARDRLEEALRQLEEGEMDMSEALAEMQEAEQLVDEGNLEMSALQESLEELARNLEGEAELQDLAEALQNQDLEAAAEAMRELAQQLGEEGASQEAMERLQQAAESDSAAMQELMEALQEAAEQMAQENNAEAQEAMEQAAQAMQAMSEQMAAQELMNQASEQMEGLQQSMAQQMQMEAEAGEQQSAGMEPGQQAQGESSEAGAMAMPSDDVELTSGGDQAQQPSQDPQGGPTGHATGDPMGGEAPLGDATRLDVQLEMEILDSEQPPEEEAPRPEQLFEDESRQEEARVQFQDVRQRTDFARGSALNVERIPWRYRNLVKLYFLAIRPQGDDDNRN